MGSKDFCGFSGIIFSPDQWGKMIIVFVGLKLEEKI
jgi:hypothetical protein